MKSAYPTKPLGEIIALEYGKPLPEKDRDPDGSIPAYGANGILCWAKKPYKDVASIIVGRKGSAGEVNLTEGAFWPTDVTYFVEHDKSKTDLKYLYYFLKFLDLPKLARGVKPGINRNDVYSLPAPVPSLSEQEQIVAILDEAFEGIAAATTNAEKNLANARELFDTYLNSVFSEKMDGCIKRNLEEVVATGCTLSYGIVQPGNDFENGIPVVRPTDLTSEKVFLDGLKRIDPRVADSYQRTKLQGGEILLCVRGSTGVISIADKTLKGANVTRGIVPISFAAEVISQDFGFYLLASKVVQNQIRAKTYGAALMQINIRDLRKIFLLIPPLSQQLVITKKLQEISGDVERVQSIYQKKISAFNELKQSLLQKAFSGELTAKTAKAAKKEAVA